MIVNVLSYTGRKYPYEIKNEKNLRGIVIKIISGDHVITPLYEDGSVGSGYDPMKDMKDKRIMNFYDGTFFIEASHIDDYNKLADPYDLFDKDWAERTNLIREGDN